MQQTFAGSDGDAGIQSPTLIFGHPNIINPDNLSASYHPTAIHPTAHVEAVVWLRRRIGVDDIY